MELTPLDIRKQEFRRKSFGGLDPAEVEGFLEMVAAEFERRQHENADLQEKLKQAKEQIAHFRSIEQTLQEAAVTLQRTLEERKVDAEREAGFIVAQARAEAQRETEAIRRESETLRGDVQQLRNQRANFFVRFRSLLRSQWDLLEALEHDGAEGPETSSKPASEDISFRNRRAQRVQGATMSVPVVPAGDKAPEAPAAP